MPAAAGEEEGPRREKEPTDHPESRKPKEEGSTGREGSVAGTPPRAAAHPPLNYQPQSNVRVLDANVMLMFAY